NAPRIPLPISVRHGGIGFADSFGPWIAGFFGITMGVSIGFILFKVLPEGAPLKKMFDFRNIEAVIPVTIMCLFLWGLWICLFRAHHVCPLRRISRPTILGQIRKSLKTEGDAATLRLIEPRSAEASPLLRRVRASVEQWCSSHSLQDVDVVLQQQTA